MIDIRNITISGGIGTGTTTLARMLADKLGWQFIESGEMFKSIHKDLGIVEEEVGKRPDNLDVEFDNKMKKMLSEEEKQVIEGHLAGLNAKGIAKVFKIRLVCEENGVDSVDIRATRVADRDGLSLDAAKIHLQEREQGNIAKYQRMYGANPYIDSSLYDLTINTFDHDQEGMLKLACEAIGI